jgi:hypothetical protein
MQRDVPLWTSNKLAGPWSATSIIDDLTPEELERINAAYHHLDPLVRVRLLIACALLPPERKEYMADAFKALLDRAVNDTNNWVRLYGCALDAATGTFRFDRAYESFPDVRYRYDLENCICRIRTKH